MSLTIIYEGRREVVKPTPTQSLSVIFQNACEKFKIAPSNYALFDAKGKELNLSLSYRLSGLASGAKLEIKRKAAKTASTSVLVGLQLPEGGRVQANFPSHSRLWDVLLHFEQQSEGKLNLTKREAAAGAGNGDRKRKADEAEAGSCYLQPVITYMQREVATVADLYRNTLRDLGLDGNGLLRLSFRPTEVSPESVQSELEAIRASEREREEGLRRAEEQKAKRRADEEEKMRQLRDQAEKMRETEREEFLRRAKEEAEAEEQRKEREREEKRKQEVDRLVAKKEKEMESTFREMERAAFEQTQVEQMRAAMRAHFAAPPESASTSTTTTASASAPEPKEKDKAEEADRMDVETQQKPTQSNNKSRIEIPDRELRVLPPTDRPFDPREFEVPESFYEATEDDFRVAMQAIKANRMRMEEESQMRTKEMREKDRLRKIPKYRKTLIKVRFPNRVEVQATFHPLEKAQAVHDLIKGTLAHPDRPFYLFTTPPRERVALTKSLLSQVMVPAAILYFSWEDNSGPAVEFLKEELVQDIADQIPAAVSFPQSPSTPSSSAALESLVRVLGFSSSSSSPSAAAEAQPAPRQPPREGRRDYSTVVPKWFAAGRK